jgi:tryptophanyl-tRNA synthetase
MQQVSDKNTLHFFEQAYADTSIRYGDFKKQLADDIIAFCNPLRERILDLSEKNSYIDEVIEHGAEKARQNARNTISEIREIIGFRK